MPDIVPRLNRLMHFRAWNPLHSPCGNGKLSSGWGRLFLMKTAWFVMCWCLFGTQPNRLLAKMERPSTSSNNANLPATSDLDDNALPWLWADREAVDFVEIASLCLLIIFGTILNALAFARLVRYSRTPCHGGNVKSLLTGSLYMNSFTLLKFNLALTDFAILLVHALGKVIWLLSYRWLFGDVGCRMYQFLSAFTYYSNSNVVVAIGLDRLKVVYSSRVQGTVASIQRVRIFLAIAWTLAFVCALPQLFFWTSYELQPGWSQCTTIWQIAEHHHANATSGQTRHWAANPQIQLYYELLHQAAVFVIPFISLFASYLLIVLRVLRYTLQPNSASNNFNSYSSLIGPENWSADESGRKSGRGSLRLSWRLKGISSSCFLQKLNLLSNQQKGSGQSSPDRLAVPTEVQVRLYAAPPPSPCTVANGQTPSRACPFTDSSNPSSHEQFQSRKGSDMLLVSRMTRPASARQYPRKLSAEIADNGKRLTHIAHPKRSSLNVLSSLDEQNPQAHHYLLSSDPNGMAPHLALANGAKHRYSVGKPSLGSASGGHSPVWRRQLRSKVFVRALLIVTAHCAFWLPYNLLNLLRFANEPLYSWLVEKGALLVEDLIVMNAMINPILYGYGR